VAPRAHVGNSFLGISAWAFCLLGGKVSKTIYDERCIIKALSKDGKPFTREISLTATELSRKSTGNLNLIKIEAAFKNGTKQEKETYLVSDLKIIRDYFLKKLSSAIDLIHPERQPKLTFPSTNKYLKMRRAYCQNCKKLIEEFYGFYEGRIKKCPHCNRLTTYKR
jgi:hypothetical protein